MGFPKDIGDAFSAVASPTATNSIINIEKATRQGAVDAGATNLPSTDVAPYALQSGNWYKTIAYALRSINPDSASAAGISFFFPVNPESINISTPFAVVVTPTLGGIVQEHSGPVFYNITLAGTTGIIPSIDYHTGSFIDSAHLRPLAAQNGLISPGILGGFGQNTINAINNIASAITGVSAPVASAVVNALAGYTAFHVLYRFLWWYHTAKANGSKQQLRFINYKDSNQYDCVVQNFTLTRDKSSPHLYRYQIQMKGWNIATADQAAPNSQPNLDDLGLNEGPSVKAQLFRVITDAKTVLNGAAGLLNAGASDFAT